jgi:hypothetical protein
LTGSPCLCAQLAGEGRIGDAGEAAAADLVEEAAVEADQRVRDHRRLDVRRAGAGLLGDECGE